MSCILKKIEEVNVLAVPLVLHPYDYAMIIATIITTLTVSVLSVICALPIIVVGYFNIKLYEITNQANVNLILSRLEKRCTHIVNDEISGWVYGWNYCGYIERGENKVTIKILTTETYYKALLKRENIHGSVAETSIQVCERSGDYTWPMYNSRELDVSEFTATDKQQEVIDQIRSVYETKGHCVAYIYGEAGSGKSMIATLVAKSYQSSLTFDHNPTTPGDRLSIIHSKINPRKNKPLVILFDEADIMIEDIHHKRCYIMKLIETTVRNKSTYNGYFDRIDMGMFPNLIVLMTSNQKPDYIRGLDPSYLRKGRVGVIAELIK